MIRLIATFMISILVGLAAIMAVGVLIFEGVL